MSDELGLWGIPLAVLGGAIRVSTPYLFVSLGETITEKSGRINLGLEGVLLVGAVSAYAISLRTGSPWLGVLAAGAAGAALAAVHALFCARKGVSDIAVGIAMMLFGTGLAFFFGKPYIQPEAPQLPALDLGAWSSLSQVREALRINALFFVALALAPALAWFFRRARAGLVLRMVGENAEAARALGYQVERTRFLATAAGGMLAGVAGSFLSLYYPGIWSEGLSSGQGLMAVALVIFARWNPIACIYASLLYGGLGALGPALQSAGVAASHHLLNAVPAALTLVIMTLTCTRDRALEGAPRELTFGS